MDKIDLTYSGKIKVLVNVLKEKEMDVNFTIDGETGKATTTSFLIDDSEDNFLMITIDFQELKELIKKYEAE